VLKTVGNFDSGSRWAKQILRGVFQVQTECNFRADRDGAFVRLLEIFTETTGSEYGFLGEITTDSLGHSMIKVRAATGFFLNLQTVAENTESGPGFPDLQAGYPMIKELVESGRPFISEDAWVERLMDRGATKDKGPVQFLGIPLMCGDELMGLVNLVQSRGRPDQELLDTMEPLLRTAGTLMAAGKTPHSETPTTSTSTGKGDLISPDAKQLTEPAWFTTAVHDLRAPLNATHEVLRLLGDRRLAVQDSELVQVAKDTIHSLLSFVDNTLDYSKMQAGQLEIKQAPVTIAWVIDSIMQLLGVRAAGAGIQLSSIVAADTPAMVVSDCDRMRQILLNLFDNAIVHSCAEHVSVSVQKSETGGLRFTVTDDGVGISEHDQAYIFEEFRQASSSQTGSGLGLTVARRLVLALGGEIGCTSHVNGGSSFWFTIAAPQVENSLDQPGITREFASLSIMIIAETTPQLGVLRKQLEEWGALVQLAPSVRDPAVEQFAKDAVGGEVVLVLQQPEADQASALISLRAKGIGLIWIHNIEETFVDRPDTKLDEHLALPVRQIQLRRRLGRCSGRENKASKRRYTPESVRALLPVQGASVLLVEDSVAGRMVGENMLRRYGFTVGSVENGQRAVEAVSSHHYDIVLMDLNMPVMDGIEATRRIRALDGAKAKIPVIGISERPTAEQEKKWRKLGLSDLIARPITGGSIMDALLRWLPDNLNFPVDVDTGGDPKESSEPVRVNQHVFQKLILDASMVRAPEMVDVFTRELFDRSGTIGAAIQSGKLDVVSRESHALITSARVFGATAVTEIVDRLNNASRQENMQGAKELAEELKLECAPTVRALKQLLPSGKPGATTGSSSHLDS